MSMRMTTTIELKKTTVAKLKELGKKGQTYNELLEMLMEYYLRGGSNLSS